MGKVVDNLLEVANQLVDNPETVSNLDYRSFKYIDFPALLLFDNKKPRLQSIIDRELECVFNLEKDDVEEMIDEFVVLHAQGIVKSLKYNCKDWLTVLDGELCYYKWSDDQKQNAKSWKRENIHLCESVFAKFDYIQRKSKTFKTGTVDGIVR